MKNEAIADLKSIKAKFALIFLALLLIIAAILLTNKNRQVSSTATITSQKNQFTLEAKVAKSDEENFVKLLQNLSLAATKNPKVDFTLDSTASAKLAFASPVIIKFKPGEKSLRFSGNPTTSVAQEEVVMPQIKIPKSVGFAIANNDLSSFVKKFQLSSVVENWIVQNKGQVQYFFTFEKDYVLVLKNDEIKLETLKALEENKEPLFKEDQADSTKIYIGSPVTIFAIGPTVFISSSKQAAETLLNLQKGKDDSLDFPQNQTRATLHLIYNGDQQSQSVAKEFLFGSQQTPKLVDKIKNASFTLSPTTFSGLIEIK